MCLSTTAPLKLQDKNITRKQKVRTANSLIKFKLQKDTDVENNTKFPVS